MTLDANQTDSLGERLRRGDTEALAELFAGQRPQLRRMVRLRMDRRLQGRLDPSDVLQEAFLDATQRFAEFAANPNLPMHLGLLRLLSAQRLLMLHRHHLGAQPGRDQGRGADSLTGGAEHARTARSRSAGTTAFRGTVQQRDGAGFGIEQGGGQ